MAFDGVVWNESLPDNNTVAHQIDDYNRDLRMGVRSRMAREHVWTAAQTNTNEGGHHNFITLQAQTAAPTMAGTSAGGLYIAASSAGYPFVFVNSAGSEITIVGSGASRVAAVAGATQGGIPVCSSASPTTLAVLVASAPGLTLHTNTNTGAPTWDKINLSASAQVTGTGITALRAYVSAWTAVAATQNYTFTHGLGTDNILLQLYFSTSADGSGLRTIAMNCDTGVNGQLALVSLSANTAIVRSGVMVCDVMNEAGVRVYVNAGYAQLRCLSLE